MNEFISRIATSVFKRVSFESAEINSQLKVLKFLLLKSVLISRNTLVNALIFPSNGTKWHLSKIMIHGRVHACWLLQHGATSLSRQGVFKKIVRASSSLLTLSHVNKAQSEARK